MLKHQHVGDLTGAGPITDLLLPEGRPLSYLRLAGLAGQNMSLARALLERRATEFRRRIPLACFTGPRRDEIGAILDRFEVSPVYPVLHGRSDDGSAVDVCWLDRVQLLAMGQGLKRGFRPAGRTVLVGDLKLSPLYMTASLEDGTAAAKDWQYWNSEWEFTTPAAGADSWWRVRPNQYRDRDRPLGFLPRPPKPVGPRSYACIQRPSRRWATPATW